MDFNYPGAEPTLIQALNRFIRQVLSFPWRLWRVATADLPTASTDNEGGVVYDETTSRITYSDGAAWIGLQPYNAALADIATNGLGTGIAAALAVNAGTVGAPAITGSTATIFGATGSDSRNVVTVRGTARAVRLGSTASAATIGGVDQTGTGSHQPLEISGSTINLQASLSNIVSLNSTGIDVTGLVRCDTFRLDQTPAAGTPVPTHTFTVSLNGTTYRIPCVV